MELAPFGFLAVFVLERGRCPLDANGIGLAAVLPLGASALFKLDPDLLHLASRRRVDVVHNAASSVDQPVGDIQFLRSITCAPAAT